MDGFGTETDGYGGGANFHAYITYCEAAWDHREANTNALVNPIKNNFNNNELNATTGIKDSAVVNAGLNQINIIPNPSKGIFTLEGTIKGMPGQVYVSAFDFQGNTLLQENLYNIGDKVDLTILQNGVYNICIKSNSSTILSTNKKLIIAK